MGSVSLGFFLRSNCHLCPLIVNRKVQRFPFFLSSSELRRSEVNRKVNLKYRIVLPEIFFELRRQMKT